MLSSNLINGLHEAIVALCHSESVFLRKMVGNVALYVAEYKISPDKAAPWLGPDLQLERALRLIDQKHFWLCSVLHECAAICRDLSCYYKLCEEQEPVVAHIERC